MESLALGRLVDAHVRVVGAQPQVAHVAQQVPLGVLCARRAEVRADAVERGRAQVFRPVFHGQPAQERKAAAVQHVLADRRQPGAQVGQGEVTGLQARELAPGPGARRLLHLGNLLRAQAMNPVLAPCHLRAVPDRRAFEQRGQVRRGVDPGVIFLHGATIGRGPRDPDATCHMPRQNPASP